MLQYSLVSTVGQQYTDFGLIGSAALQMVVANHDIALTEKEAQDDVLTPIRSLPAHPEVKESLQRKRCRVKSGFIHEFFKYWC
ncbi:HAD family hydrolase [Brumimicrobium mesophilum]|uniref:hypothetical protein n=1 Tax=Brumimicrobium mesophilum TaxID=392717 RepID=UPI0018FE11C3|nr:hypothetical protein [Brumimicrobium mesophilum]